MIGRLIIDALAAYRLTRLVIDDTVFDGPRDRLLAWLDPPPPRPFTDASPIQPAVGRFPPFCKAREVAELLSCYWCAGFWAAAAVTAARRLAPRAWMPAADVLAASTIVGLIADHTAGYDAPR